jgi:exonuclease III
VKVISLNTWGGRIYERLMDFVDNREADVYCFQEVFDSAGAKGFYSDETDPRKQGSNHVCSYLFEDLGAQLQGFRGFMLPACRWELLDTRAKENVPTFFGIATFVRQRLQVVESRSGFVFEQFRSISQRDKPTPRVAHALRLYDPEADAYYVVAHMHGLWIPDGKHHTPERAVQSYYFQQYIKSVAKPGDKIIACGDFNLLPDDPSFKTWQENLKLTDLVTTRGFTSTRTPLYYEKPEKQGLPLFADYMLVSPNVEVKECNVLRNEVVSDHSPLYLECA